MESHRLSLPQTFDQALELVASQDDPGIPLAGATWLMRNQKFRSGQPRHFVALRRIAALQDVRIIDSSSIWVGSMVTHSRLGSAIRGLYSLHNLHTAATQSANPNIRNMATVGGNVCAGGFRFADIVPALLSLDTQIVYAVRSGLYRVPLLHFLDEVPRTPFLVRGFIVGLNRNGIGAHVRLPLNAAGSYPAAIVTGTASITDGIVRELSVAVGAIGADARRWSRFEESLIGQRLSPHTARYAASRCLDELTIGDDLGMPSDYRRHALPGLAGQFADALLTQWHVGTTMWDVEK